MMPWEVSRVTLSRCKEFNVTFDPLLSQVCRSYDGSTDSVERKSSAVTSILLNQTMVRTSNVWKIRPISTPMCDSIKQKLGPKSTPMYESDVWTMCPKSLSTKVCLSCVLAISVWRWCYNFWESSSQIRGKGSESYGENTGDLHGSVPACVSFRIIRRNFQCKRPWKRLERKMLGINGKDIFTPSWTVGRDLSDNLTLFSSIYEHACSHYFYESNSSFLPLSSIWLSRW